MENKVPYIVELTVSDSELKRSLSKLNWEELLGIERGGILKKAFLQEGEAARNAIERELGGIDWKGLLGPKQFEVLEKAIAKVVKENKSKLQSLLDVGDTKGVEQLLEKIVALGNEFSALGGNFNLTNLFKDVGKMATTIGKLQVGVESLNDAVKNLQNAYGMAFDDKGKGVKAIKSFDMIGKALLKIGSDKSAINNLRGIEGELDRIQQKSQIVANVKINDSNLDEEWNKNLNRLEEILDGRNFEILLDKEGIQSYTDEAKELYQIFANIKEMQTYGKSKGLNLLKEAVQDGVAGLQDYDYSGGMKDLTGDIDQAMKLLKSEIKETANEVKSELKSIISGLTEVSVNLTLTEGAKENLRNSINNYVKELNESADKINPVRINTIIGHIKDRDANADVQKIAEDVNKTESKGGRPSKYDGASSKEVNRVKEKIVKEIASATEQKIQAEKAMDALIKQYEESSVGQQEKHSAGIKSNIKDLEIQIKAYEDVATSYQAMLDLMNTDPQAAVDIAKIWNSSKNSFKYLETLQQQALSKAEVWKQKMIKSLTFASSDLDNKFDFGDAGEQLYNAINAYLSDDAHKLLVNVDAKHLADQVSGILNANGINLGGGGNVNLDAKELGNIIASVMNSVLTGASMPAFGLAPQEQQADVIEEVAQETIEATSTTVQYVHSINESTIGLEHFINTLKEFATVANGVKFENGKDVPTASKGIRAFAEWLTGKGLDISKIDTMGESEIKQMIQDALFTQLSDLSAKGGTLPSDIEDWMSGRFKKDVKFKDGSIVDVFQKAIKEVFVNNGISTESSEQRIKRQQSLDVFYTSARAGETLKALNSVRSSLYPGNELTEKNIPTLEKIENAINVFTKNGWKTDQLDYLKMAREDLDAGKMDITQFKQYSDDFFNSTKKVKEGLDVLYGNLKARVTIAGRNTPIDVSSPKQAAKLLQEGVTITNAEIYADASTNAFNDAFVGSTQYRNSSKAKSKREEQNLIRSGDLPSYYTGKLPVDFGKYKNTNILDEVVDVAEFKPQTLIIEGRDVNLEGEIAKAQQKIERNKAELQAVEAEIQKSALDVKRQQTNVKRARTTNSKFNADIQTPKIKIDSTTNKLSTKIQKKDLLARIQQGELLNSGDITYIQQIKELYPDIYKLMVGVKENTAKYKEYMAQVVEKYAPINEIKNKIAKIEADELKYLELSKIDPKKRTKKERDDYRYLSSTQKLRETDKTKYSEMLSVVEKQQRPYIDELNVKKSHYQNQVNTLNDSIVAIAKEAESKLTQQIDGLKNKSKSLMVRFEREIEGLYTDINNTSQKLADKNSGLSRQDREILINSLQEKVKVAELVEAQYVEFAKKVGLNTSMGLKSYGSVVRNTVSPYLDPALNVAGNKKSKLSEEESKLAIKQREFAENEKKKKQLEEDSAHQEQLIKQYEAQKAVQGEINQLLEQQLKLQESINELVRQGASEEDISAERLKLSQTEQQLKDIYEGLKKTGGFVPTERKFNTTKEAIKSDVLSNVVEYDKEVKILTAQKYAYEREVKALEERKSKHMLAGAVINTKAQRQKDWTTEYMRDGADVVKAETELRDSTKLAIQSLIEPIEADYQQKINNLFSNFNKNVADAMKKQGLNHLDKNVKEDFLASDNIGKYLAQTYADQKSNLEDTKNKDITNVSKQAWDKYEEDLKELRNRMRDDFIKTIQVSGDVISVTFDKLDSEGNVTQQSYTENVKQTILDQIKKEKDELKSKHKPSEIQSKLDTAKQYRAEALEAGEFSEGVLLNPQAAQEQITLMTELLAISDKLYEKQQELASYESAGLNGKDKNVRALRKEITALTAQKADKERDIENRDEALARELANQSNKVTLTTEEELAQAIERRSKLQDQLARSTEILTQKQEAYNAAKGTENAEKAWVELETAKKYQQKYKDQLGNVDARIARLTAKSTTETQVATTDSGTTVQGGLVGVITNSIKDSLSGQLNFDKDGLATEKTLEAILRLLSGNTQGVDGGKQSTKGRKKKNKTANINIPKGKDLSDIVGSVTEIVKQQIVDEGIVKGTKSSKTSQKKTAKVGNMTALRSATTKYNDIVTMIGGEDNFKTATKQIRDFKKEFEDLQKLYAKYAKSGQLNDPKVKSSLAQEVNRISALGKQAMAEFKKTQELQNKVENSGGFTDKKGKWVDLGGTKSVGNIAPGETKQALRDYAQELYGVELQHVKINNSTNTLTATLRQNDYVVSEVAVTYDKASGALYAFNKGEKESLTGLPGFMKGLKEKTKAISQYLVSMTSIYRVFGEIRKGIQYIRDIDLALTELKKVTNETDETYRKFLDTASTTAAKVGSTIKEVVSSTADFARLGYTLKEAATFAESAQILMNVSEFTDVSRATDTLISAVQAFGYTAETSMEVVDLLNMIGNNYAISTADLAQSLTKSSASLVAAGGNLAEAAALTATANKIIQDADSVGTALKTTSLRLRGTSVDILNEEGLDSEGAVTSKSKLQSKVKALSGVDILTETGEYKSTYEILSQIANVWERINDMDQAALLELISGKRNSSVIAAILQNPKELEEAFKDASNAEGSALRENEKYLDSIQGRIDLLTNAIQTMWKNTLDSDVVKWFVDIATQLVKWLDKLGSIKTLLAGIFVYANKKYNFIDFSSFFTNAKKAEAKLKALQAQRAKLGNPQSEKNRRKIDLLDQEINKYQAMIQPNEDLVAAQDKLAKAQNRLANTKSTNPATLKKYQYEINKAKANVDQLSASQKKAGKTGNNAFAGLGASVKNFAKQVSSALIQMAVMWAIFKVIELATEWIDSLTTTTEEAAEEFENLTSELEGFKDEIESVNDKLETLDDQIAELNAKGSLTFAEQEELDRLIETRSELERILELNQQLADQKQQQVNSKISQQVADYKNKGVTSGKTKKQNLHNAGSTGAAIGAVAGVATGVGTAILGAKAGATLGVWAGPVGMAIGAAVGAVAGGIVGIAVGAATSASEETIGGSIDNMETTLAQKQKAVEDAREQYEKTGSEEDKKKYEDAQIALSDYRGQMAQYFSDIDEMYQQVDLSTIEDPDEYKRLTKEMNDFYNERDKWLILSGANGAKSNAIGRIFSKDEYKEASDIIDSLLEKLEQDPTNQTIIAQISEQCKLAEADLQAVGLSAQDAIEHFVLLGKEANFDTIAGKIAEVGRAGINFENLLKGEKFNVDGIEIGLADLFDEEGKITQSKLSQIFQDTSKQTRKDITRLLEGSYEQIKDGTVDTERLMEGFGLAATQQIIGIQNKLLAEQNIELFPNLKDEIDGIIDKFNEFSAAIGDVVGAMDTLEKARAEEANSGSISIETLENLMKYTDDYTKLVEVDETGAIKLAADAEKILIEQRIEKIKTDAAAAVQTALVNLEQAKYNERAANETLPVQNALTAATDWVAGSFAYLGSLIKDISDGNFDGIWDRANEAYKNKRTEREEARVEVTLSTEDAQKAYDRAIAQQNIANALTPENIKGKYEAGEYDTVEDVEKAERNKLIKYYDNRLAANQAKQDQVQNEIDLAEKMGMKADKSYYDEKLKLMAEQEALLQQKKADLLVELGKVEEGSDEWWEIANELNDIEGELDDVTASIVDLQDAIGEIDTYKFDEFGNRLDKLTSKLQTMRDLMAPNGEEDWFDEEGNWTEKGTAVLGSYLQELEFYKQGLAQVEADMEEFGNKSYNDLTQEQRDSLAERGIHSEQEYYDWVTKLDDEQLKYLSSISDTEIAIGDMYEASIDAVEEYTQTLVESYNDYIDVCKEALDAERDLYDFKKNVQKQNKDIAATERRIAALSGSTNAADIAERRKLEAQLLEQKESLNDAYYEHSIESQQDALDGEAQAYEESMNRFVENLRISLDSALENMDSFLAGVSASVMVNAQVVKDQYIATGVTLDDALVEPWNDAIAAIGTYETDGLSKMNAWTTDSGFFGQFATGAKDKLTGFWGDGVKACDNFKISINGTLEQISASIATNVAKWQEDIASAYEDIKDSEENPPQLQGQGDTPEDNSHKTYHVTGSLDNPKLSVSGVGATAQEATDNAKTNLAKAFEKYHKDKNTPAEEINDLWLRKKNSATYTSPSYYAKGTLGTSKSGWAITDELGDELVLVPGANGNLSFMRKGTSVIPADITANLVEWGKLNPDMLKIGGGTNINMISNAVNKPELNFAFDSLVHVDHCDQNTLKDLEQMVDNKINQFNKQLNYSLKRFSK